MAAPYDRVLCWLPHNISQIVAWVAVSLFDDTLGDTLIASVESEKSIVGCTKYTAYCNAPLLVNLRIEWNIQRQNVKDVSHSAHLGSVGCFRTFKGPRSCELIAFYLTTTPRPHWLIRRQPSVPSHSLRTLAQPSRQEDASALRHYCVWMASILHICHRW